MFDKVVGALSGAFERFFLVGPVDFDGGIDLLLALTELIIVERFGDNGRLGSSFVIVDDRTVKDGVNVVLEFIALLSVENDDDDDGTVLLMITRGVGVVTEVELSDDDRISDMEFIRSYVKKENRMKALLTG